MKLRDAISIASTLGISARADDTHAAGLPPGAGHADLISSETLNFSRMREDGRRTELAAKVTSLWPPSARPASAGMPYRGWYRHRSRRNSPDDLRQDAGPT